MGKNKLLGIIIGLALLILVFPGSATAGPKTPSIDKSKLGQGLIAVEYDEAKRDEYLIRISRGAVSDDYKLTANAAYPLTAGNGDYKVTIGELVDGKRYKVVADENITLKLKDEKIVFLQSSNMINWNDKTKAVVKARELTKTAKNDQEKLALIYKYVVNNVKYDNEKAATIKSGYMVNLDAVFNTNTGICYDYATMTAAMLRSVGVPTKLVMGYHKDDKATYHAWNQVYVGDQWVTIDTTYDAPVIQAQQVTAMIKLDSLYADVHKIY